MLTKFSSFYAIYRFSQGAVIGFCEKDWAKAPEERAVGSVCPCQSTQSRKEIAYGAKHAAYAGTETVFG